MIGMVLDGVVLLALLVTIGFAVRLNSRIAQIHNGREELNRFLSDFNAAIDRAEENIAELKLQGQVADDTLKEYINKGSLLADDLVFLVEKGDSTADALDKLMSSARTVLNQRQLQGQLQARRPSMAEREGAVDDAPAAAPKREASGKGSRAAVARKQPPSAPQKSQSKTPSAETMTPTKRKVLDEVLEQIARRKQEVLKDILPPVSVQPKKGVEALAAAQQQAKSGGGEG